MSVEAQEELLTDEDIEAGNTKSEEVFLELVNTIEDAEEDSGVILFSLWIKLTYELISTCGWTGEELVKEVASYTAMFESERTA